jgi:hypothetical protein
VLTLLSLAYLALPNFLFALTWLRWPYAIGVSAALAAGLTLVARQVILRDGLKRPEEHRVSRFDLGVIAFLLLCMMVISGIGRIGYQRADWFKHNSILHDLSTMDWPVAYGSGPDACLSYYVAYYLPAAQIGRWSDVDTASLALFVWSAIGLGLAAAWVLRLVGSRSWLVVGAWLVLSGLDIVGFGLFGGVPRDQMQWWAEFAQYPSNPRLLFWVPQHALSGWIATAIFVDWLERHRSLLMVGLCAAMAALWSPFITIGLFPLALFGAVRVRFKDAFTVPNLVAAPPLLFVCVAYLRSVPLTEIPREWCWENLGWRGALEFWLVFCLLEFGIFLALYLLLWRRSGPEVFHRAEWTPTWLAAVGSTLLILPLYRLGMYNDLAMRASLPALFMLWIVLLRVRWPAAWRAQPVLTQALVLCLALGAFQPVSDITEQLVKTRASTDEPGIPGNLSIVMLHQNSQRQYLGDPDSFFFRYLARK